jgi:hypothetical protein
VRRRIPIRILPAISRIVLFRYSCGLIKGSVKQAHYPGLPSGVSIMGREADAINGDSCTMGFRDWLHTLFGNRPAPPHPSRRQKRELEEQEEEEIEELVALDII